MILASKTQAKSKENPHPISSSKRLQTFRKMFGVSQRQIAVEFGVVHGAIGQWERGRRKMPGPALKLLDLYEGLAGLNTSQDLQAVKVKNRDGSEKNLITAIVEQMQRIIGDKPGVPISSLLLRLIVPRLVESLGKSNGLLRKCSQFISTASPHLICLESNDQFEIFRGSTQSGSSRDSHESTSTKIFRLDFGLTATELFSSFEVEPIAKASIGQVHRGRLHSGEQVAIKIQYPGIAKKMKRDLSCLTTLDLGLRFLFPGLKEPFLLSEARQRLLEECDYTIEFENQLKFRSFLSSNSRIKIPNVFKDFSSQRVLTSDFIDGMDFRTFLLGSSQEEKNRAAETIWDFSYQSIFKHCVFNYDPHPGNYLFTKNQVVFLDFGGVKTFTDAFVTKWKELGRAVVEGNRNRIKRLLVDMDFIPKEGLIDRDYCVKIINEIFEPWRVNRRYLFTKSYVANLWKTMVVANPNRFTMNMPKEWLFAHRLQWGLYSMMSFLNAESNWHERVIALLYD